MIDTKPFLDSIENKPVAVLGLGVSGLATIKALKAPGARVFAWDDDPEKCAQAKEEGAEISPFSRTFFEREKNIGAMIVSPGVPLHHPQPHPDVLIAREKGVPILGDLEILHRCFHGWKTIGITGTNGKSTTTALIHHILTNAGYECVMGGNIGMPVLALDLPSKTGILVLEISSYQMDLCPSFRPDISVLLNITPDHIDRHGTLEAYASAKERIFEGKGTAICAVDDSFTREIALRIGQKKERKLIPFSVCKKIERGVFVDKGFLFDIFFDLGFKEREQAVASVLGMTSLLGAHNHQNICAAYAVCCEVGLDGKQVLEHCRTYEALPHRQKLVRIINGVSYVNDSKATNAEATTKALSCYRNIYLIAGGRPKETGLEGVEDYVDRLCHVFLIGEAMDDFDLWFKKMGVPCSKSGTLDVAVLEAHHEAQKNRGVPGQSPTVLLSPACASWDQFSNFGHRGTTFESLVYALSEDISV